MRLFVLIAASLLLTACGPDGLSEEDAAAMCVERCLGISYVLDSQCLGTLDDVWVCDVAHDPRAPTDGIIDAQCPEYRAGSHPRIVEVTPRCAVILAE